MIKTKKLVWAKFLAKALCCGVLATLLFGLTTTSTVAKAETSTPLYVVNYGYWQKENKNYLESGIKSFNNDDELISWVNDVINNKASDTSFARYSLTLNGNGNVYIPNTYTATFNINNKSFNFIDSNKNVLNTITLDVNKSLITIQNANISPNIVWNLNNGSNIYFENCVIDGGGRSYSQDLFNIGYKAQVNGYNFIIKNFNLSGNTEIFDILTGGYGERYCAVSGGDTDQGKLEINNVHVGGRKGIVQVENNACLSYVRFVNCSSVQAGGACYVNGGSLYHCIFDGCSSTNDCGGAVYVDNGYVDWCTFSNCWTSNENAGDGGALYLKGDNSFCHDSTFSNNTSKVDGGAICVKGNYVEINRCHFYYNHARDDGGAVYVCASAVDTHVYNCDFKGNWADDDCNNVDECSDTLVKWCYYGSTISEGSIFLIIEIATVLIAVTVILVILKLRPKIKKDEDKDETPCKPTKS